MNYTKEDLLTKSYDQVYKDTLLSRSNICKWCVDNYQIKPCSKCKEFKLVDLFGRNTAVKCGYNSQCKECSCATFRSHKLKNNTPYAIDKQENYIKINTKTDYVIKEEDGIITILFT